MVKLVALDNKLSHNDGIFAFFSQLENHLKESLTTGSPKFQTPKQNLPKSPNLNPKFKLKLLQYLKKFKDKI